MSEISRTEGVGCNGSKVCMWEISRTKVLGCNGSKIFIWEISLAKPLFQRLQSLHLEN